MSLQFNRVPIKNSAVRGPALGVLVGHAPRALVHSPSDQPFRKNGAEPRSLKRTPCFEVITLTRHRQI